jgi:hypothetical protein
MHSAAALCSYFIFSIVVSLARKGELVISKTVRRACQHVKGGGSGHGDLRDPAPDDADDRVAARGRRHFLVQRHAHEQLLAPAKVGIKVLEALQYLSIVGEQGFALERGEMQSF